MIGPEEMPVCPVCGEEVNELYISSETREVVGCPHCVKPTDAFEYTEEQQLSEAIDRYIERENDRRYQ